MKRLLFPLILVVLFPVFAMAQSVPVSFTGRDANNCWVQLDRVVITDLTKGWSETIVWPDTTLTMQNGTGIYDVETMCTSSLQLFQNNPNPFNGTTDVLLTLADADAVTLEITDVNGRVVVPAMDISTIVRANDYSPRHQFRISLSTVGTYIMTARQNGKTSSIKMVNNGGGKDDDIEYGGIVRVNDYSPRQFRGNTTNPFNIGDQMEYVGYATIDGEECESQHVTQAQETAETIVLQFVETLCQLPSVATDAVSNINDSSAICGGEVIADGGGEVIARGVCWSTNANPTVADSYTTDGSGMGSFISILTGLTPNTTYYVRAYATNAAGTTYGNEVDFTTTGIDDPIDVVYNYSVEDTVFIPDGPNCTTPCYNSSIAVTTFPPNAVVSRAADILGVRLKIEHSSIGDINISLICPNGTSALLMPDHAGSIGGSNSTDMGIAYKPDGSSCDASDNTPGTGWNYCWSENYTYAQNSGYCFLTVNTGNDYSSTIDSSHVAHGYPGDDDFVQGQQYYTPYQSFENLIGCPMNGIWQIRVCDTWGSDNGYAFGWGITFSPGLNDIDGNVYNTVAIGSQCWMKENLRSTHYADNTPIPAGDTENSCTEPYRYALMNDEANVPVYGYLYNWPAVMHGASSSYTIPSGVQGICPDGWHVPSVAEWTQLTTFVSSQSQYVCGDDNRNIAKSLADTARWTFCGNNCAIGSDLSSNNATGFSVIPVGNRVYSSGFQNFGAYGFFWTCTEIYESTTSFFYQFSFCDPRVDNGSLSRDVGYSVRCVKD